MKKKVLVAMSGGVDSSVAAAVLMNDYEVTGATMKLFTNEDIQLDRQKTCCSLDDVEDARYVAHKLGFEHYVYNFGDRFKECVIDRFNNAYINGDTPNPCIDCNRFIKFNALLKRAELLGMDYIATGHYVRREFDEKSQRYILKKGLDETKDQSYVLYGMTQEQLAKTLFPVGNLTKNQTRAIALEKDLINAEKPDSQDICFVPDGDYAGFIERYTKKTFPKGNFIDKTEMFWANTTALSAILSVKEKAWELHWECLLTLSQGMSLKILSHSVQMTIYSPIPFTEKK